MNRDGGEQKPEARLDGQRRPHIARIAEFRHARRELRRVGDDARAPHRREEDERPRARAEQEPDEQAARAAQAHRRGGDGGAPHAVGQKPRRHAAQRARADDDEGRAFGHRHRLPARLEARAEHHGQPRPHRIQLPHVAEVSEVGEPHAAVAKDARHLSYVELRRGQRVGAFAHEQQHNEPARDGEPRGEQHIETPVRAPQCVDQIRRSLAQRERAHQHAQSHPAPAPEPRRHDLHPRRVNAREEKSDEKTQSDARRQVRREEPEGGVRECASEGAERDQTARAHDIRQIEERTEERPRDEAELHGQRQPARARLRQTPLRSERGHDRRGREPQRHRQKLGDRQQGERTPTPRALGSIQKAILNRCILQSLGGRRF